jgi:MFS family permease
MFTLGVSMVQTFGLYFLKDKVGPVYRFLVWDNVLKTAEQALAAFMLLILLSGMCSSITGGIISDRIGRKPIIMLSGLLVSTGCVAMCFITNYNLILLLSIFVGLGTGSYYGTDLSLANDIIGTKEVAKSIALFQLAQNFPMVLANPLGGLLLMLGNSLSERKIVNVTYFGYNILFAVASVLTISSSFLVMLVKQSNVKKMSTSTSPIEDIPIILDNEEPIAKNLIE